MAAPNQTIVLVRQKDSQVVTWRIVPGAHGISGRSSAQSLTMNCLRESIMTGFPTSKLRENVSLTACQKEKDFITDTPKRYNCETNDHHSHISHVKVVDGTSCDDEGRRVCVDGDCSPVIIIILIIIAIINKSIIRLGVTACWAAALRRTSAGCAGGTGAAARP